MLLEIAALLHDIGVFIKFAHHNFHSAYIIQNSDIFGLTKREISIVAEISKYHRGSQMPQDEENFLMMPRSDRMLILKLTAILRIADAMDRGHIQTFNDISVKLQQNALLITTKNSKNPVLERIALQEKAGMFESVFGYNVILV
jgi:exopolyphosphatase/guanosine-5'-triphosphate,3'-diphosphate pyrophosphatase